MSAVDGAEPQRRRRLARVALAVVLGLVLTEACV